MSSFADPGPYSGVIHADDSGLIPRDILRKKMNSASSMASSGLTEPVTSQLTMKLYAPGVRPSVSPRMSANLEPPPTANLPDGFSVSYTHTATGDAAAATTSCLFAANNDRQRHQATTHRRHERDDGARLHTCQDKTHAYITS
jgi:hypothetical protein